MGKDEKNVCQQCLYTKPCLICKDGNMFFDKENIIRTEYKVNLNEYGSKGKAYYNRAVTQERDR
ncbi:MAG: hypothetical protein HOL31_02015 [Candidatus Scalindua sp.]|jgi:hypothetical protein|nr:hypothetical protein [Candidatus Scalindua sp.]MBT7350547.1 hypothetical protein [candidate division WWE3 bacterium]